MNIIFLFILTGSGGISDFIYNTRQSFLDAYNMLSKSEKWIFKIHYTPLKSILINLRPALNNLQNPKYPRLTTTSTTPVTLVINEVFQ